MATLVGPRTASPTLVYKARPRSSLQPRDRTWRASGHWADDESLIHASSRRFISTHDNVKDRSTTPHPYPAFAQAATHLTPSNARSPSAPIRDSVVGCRHPPSPAPAPSVQTPNQSPAPHIIAPTPRHVQSVRSPLFRVASPIGTRVATPVQRYTFDPVVEDDDDQDPSRSNSIAVRMNSPFLQATTRLPSPIMPPRTPNLDPHRRLLTPLSINSTVPVDQYRARSPHSPILSDLAGRLTPRPESQQETLKSALERTAHLRINLSPSTSLETAPHCRGGYGDVYRIRLGRRMVAAKRIYTRPQAQDNDPKQTLLRYLLREVVPWCDVDHPNVARLIGYSYDQESAWMFSEWQPNGNASEYVRQQPGINRLGLIQGVAQGLAHLHSRYPAVVHGDLKPENIVVDADGVPKLVDFGLSIVIDGSFTRGFLSSSSFRGTLRYADPTLTLNKPKTTHSDVWALGWLAYVILTGTQRPYDHLSNDFAVYQALLNYEVPTPKTGKKLPRPDIVWPMLAGCWCKDTKYRWTAAQLARHLQG